MRNPGAHRLALPKPGSRRGEKPAPRSSSKGGLEAGRYRHLIDVGGMWYCVSWRLLPMASSRGNRTISRRSMAARRCCAAAYRMFFVDFALFISILALERHFKQNGQPIARSHLLLSR